MRRATSWGAGWRETFFVGERQVERDLFEGGRGRYIAPAHLSRRKVNPHLVFFQLPSTAPIPLPRSGRPLLSPCECPTSPPPPPFHLPIGSERRGHREREGFRHSRKAVHSRHKVGRQQGVSA